MVTNREKSDREPSSGCDGSSLLKASSIATLGLSCFWLMLRYSAISHLFPYYVLEATGVSALYYCLLASTAALVAVALAPLGQFLARDPRASMGISTAFGVVAGAILLTSDLSGPTVGALRVVGTVLGAAAFTALLAQWVSVCSALKGADHRAFLAVLILSSSLTLVFSFGNYVSETIADTKIVVSVPASAICAGLSMRYLPKPAKTTKGGARDLLAVALMAVFLTMATVIRHTSAVGVGDATVTSELMGNYFFTVMGGVVCLFAVVFVSDRANLGYCLMLVCVFMLATGYFVLGFLGDGESNLSSNLITSARALLEVFLFASCVTFSDGSGRRVAVALFAGVELVAALLRRLILPSVAWSLGVSFDELSKTLSPFLCFTLLVFCVAVLAFVAMAGRRAGLTVESDEERDGGKEADLAMVLAERYGLTPREAVVASYIARGYSSPAIAQTESLSTNTVTSHARNIYTKLGIHSRQELIELAADVSSEP